MRFKIFEKFKSNKKIRKEIKEMKKDHKLMFKDLDLMGDEIDKQRNIISQQSIGLAQAYSNTRELFLGANDFILSSHNPSWKGIKIMLGKDDITNKTSKIVIFGPSFIEE